MRLVCILVLPMLLLCATARADEAGAWFDWRPINRHTADLLSAGSYAEARGIVMAARAGCPQAATGAEAGLCAGIFDENLSAIVEHDGDLVQAEALLRSFVRARVAAVGTYHPLVADALTRLSWFHRRHNQFRASLAEGAAADRIAHAASPGDPATLAAALETHGASLIALGRAAAAVPLMAERRDLLAAAYGVGDLRTLDALRDRIDALRRAGDHDAAIDEAASVLMLPGAGAFDLAARAAIAAGLKADINSRERADRALPALESVLDAYAAAPGHDPALLFDMLLGLANTHIFRGEGPPAVELGRRARGIADGAWGVGSAASLRAMEAEALGLSWSDRRQEAADLMAVPAALAIGPSMIEIRAEFELQLMQMRADAGHADDGRNGLLAFSRSPALLLPGTPLQGVAMSIVGEKLRVLGIAEKGRALCDRAMEVIGPNRDGTARWAVRSAGLCSARANLALGRPARALPGIWLAASTGGADAFELKVQALTALGETDALIQAYLAAGPPARAWFAIARLHREEGHPADAARSAAQALATLPDGSDDPPRADILAEYGHALADDARAGEAVDAFEQALALRPGPDGAAIGVGLAEALLAANRPADSLARLDALDVSGAEAKVKASAAIARASASTALGDLADAEAALRDAMALVPPNGWEMAAVRRQLAGLWDRVGRHDEADAARRTAIATVASGDAASVTWMRIERAAALRQDGRFGDAAAELDRCDMRAMLYACERARAELALAVGRVVDADAAMARSLADAEQRFGPASLWLRDTLLLRARIAANLGDPARVDAFCDRADRLTTRADVSLAMREIRGRLLWMAGVPDRAVAVEREVLKDARAAADAQNVTDATSLLAEHTIANGDPGAAMALWQDAAPIVADAARERGAGRPGVAALRIAVLRGMADASRALLRFDDAERLYAAAADLARATAGEGSALWRGLVSEQADARAEIADSAGAAEMLLSLGKDDSLAAREDLERSLAGRDARKENGVASLDHLRARETLLRQSGAGDVAGAFAWLDSEETALGVAEPDPEAAPDPEPAIEAILTQDPSWDSEIRVLMFRAAREVRFGDLEGADARYADIEARWRAHRGTDCLTAASVHGLRAAMFASAEAWDEADRLYGEALAAASPGGRWRNATWASLAAGAATAADRVGDSSRARAIWDALEELRGPPAAPSRTGAL